MAENGRQENRGGEVPGCPIWEEKPNILNWRKVAEKVKAANRYIKAYGNLIS